MLLHKHTHTHTHTVCPQLLGPQVHTWVLPSCRLKGGSSRGDIPAWGRLLHPPPSPTASHKLRDLFFHTRLHLFGQPADRQVVYHLLNFLYVVLEAVVTFSQRVVLQV